MPQIARITSTFFTNLISRLGIRPPFSEGFEVSNVIQPVSIVDSDITFSALSTTQSLGTPFTVGALGAPAAGTVLADTGAQNAGIYQLFIVMSAGDGVGTPAMDLQRRDAANAANIWVQRFWGMGGGPNGQSGTAPMSFRVELAASERIRVTVGPAGGAGSGYQASIWLTPVT